MEIKVIRNEDEHKAALAEIERLWDAAEGSAEWDCVETLAVLVEDYESERFPAWTVTPVEAIKFQMDQKGLKRKDLEPMIGSRGRVAEIMNGRRPLTIQMIRALSKHLSIPADLLIAAPKPVRKSSGARRTTRHAVRRGSKPR